MAPWVELASPPLFAESALRALATHSRPFLLEGSPSLAGDGLGRFSYAGCDPRAVLRLEADVIDDASQSNTEDPWESFARWVASHRSDDCDVPAMVGFVTYEAGRLALSPPLPPVPVKDALGLPLFDWAYYDAVFRRDEASGECVVLAETRAAGEALLAKLAARPPAIAPLWPVPLVSDWDDTLYRSNVVKIIDYLVAGDAYQVNLTKQLRAPFALEDALPAYLAVRRGFAAPLGAYLHSGEVAVIGNSPELLLRRRGTHIESRPIKGTRPREIDAAEDVAAARTLAASEKDRAEHVMIVDLVRHDLGQLATIGSVSVDLLRALPLPTVHHLVSTVRAEVPRAVETAALLRAVMPGGSVTGAPKRRAMQIIDELEGRQRGVYCGALGWIAPNGDCDLALPIRTAVATGGELVLGVGGGIVVDSDPDAELAECAIKAAAFVRALSG